MGDPNPGVVQGPTVIPSNPKHILHAVTECPFYFIYLFLRQSFALVTQTGVQWRDLGSPQPPLWVQAILLPQPPE